MVGLNIYLVKVIQFQNRIFLTALTFSIAGLILLIVNVILGKINKAFAQIRKNFLKLSWIGIIGTSIPMSIVFYGLSLSPISNTFLLQVEVIYSMILSRILLKEQISKQQILLSLSSIFGICLITTEGTLRGINIGDLLFLLAPFFFQCAHVVAKNLMQKVNPIIVVMYRFLIGGLTLFPFSTLLSSGLLEDLPTQMLDMIIFLSISYAIGNSLWYYGVKKIALSKATAIMITYPLIATFLAIGILGESPSTIKVIGIMMVFLSVLKLSLLKPVENKKP